jgi:hypothetical protein
VFIRIDVGKEYSAVPTTTGPTGLGSPSSIVRVTSEGTKLKPLNAKVRKSKALEKLPRAIPISKNANNVAHDNRIQRRIKRFFRSLKNGRAPRKTN